MVNGWVGALRATLAAGMDQALVVGPTGCGKTTVAESLAAERGQDCTRIDCGFGTPAYTFTGRRHPISGEYEETEFVRAYKGGGFIIIDEMDSLDPAVACGANAALANGTIATPNGTINRHPDTIIVATANTWGKGADRVYVGRNQLNSFRRMRAVVSR